MNNKTDAYIMASIINEEKKDYPKVGPNTPINPYPKTEISGYDNESPHFKFPHHSQPLSPDKTFGYSGRSGGSGTPPGGGAGSMGELVGYGSTKEKEKPKPKPDVVWKR